MSDDHHSHGPFDPDDPFSMMGIAMVGMALQEAAEEEERQRRSRLAPWQRAAEDRRNQEVGARMGAYVLLALVAGALIFACLLATAR